MRDCAFPTSEVAVAVAKLNEPRPRPSYCPICSAGPLIYSGVGRPPTTCGQSSCFAEHRRRRERAVAAQRGQDRPHGLQEPLADGAAVGGTPVSPQSDAESDVVEPITEPMRAVHPDDVAPDDVPVDPAVQARLDELADSRNAGFGDDDRRSRPQKRSHPGRRLPKPFG